jgi:dTMP kinase
VRSLFIVIDGADGVGKSTLAAALHERIEGSVLTREPGGCPGSEEIRGVFLSHHWTPMAELYLLAAGRAQHISDVILPALDAGKTVMPPILAQPAKREHDSQDSPRPIGQQSPRHQ